MFCFGILEKNRKSAKNWKNWALSASYTACKTREIPISGKKAKS